MIADQAKPALGLKPSPVKCDDSGRFLPAMLERVQPEGGDGGRVGVTEYAENPAFFMQMVAVKIDIGIARQERRDSGLAGFVAALDLGVAKRPVKAWPAALAWKASPARPACC
jgi:hypothetical protein